MNPTLAGWIKAEDLGGAPSLAGDYNQLMSIVFLAGPGCVSSDQGQHLDEQMTALANGWKKRFAKGDTPFIYTLPSTGLAT